MLGLPMLGSATRLTQHLQQHRNMAGILQEAGVPMVDTVILDPVPPHADRPEEPSLTDEEWLWLPLAKLMLRHSDHEWWELLLDIDPAGERRAGCRCDKTRLDSFAFMNEQRRLYADEWSEGSRVQVRKALSSVCGLRLWLQLERAPHVAPCGVGDAVFPFFFLSTVDCPYL